MPEVAKFLSERTKYMVASEIRELLKAIERDVISFAGGMPDPATFPAKEISEIVSDILAEKYDRALQYGPTEGVKEFREAIIEFEGRVNGIKVPDISHVIVTTGSQQALDLTGKIFVDPGDYIIVEKPTYLAALQAWRPYKPRFVGVDIDFDGMKVDELEKVIKKVLAEGGKIKFIYTIPTCQNPAGVTMSEERRKALLEIASKYDLLIIEDNPYGYLLFEDKRYTPLKAMDKEGRVIYLSTASKILCPGLRIGWIIAEPEIINRYVLAKQAADLCTPTLNQYIFVEAVKRGVIERHIPKIRQLYKRKRDIMLEALDEYFKDKATWTRPVGGMFIFVWLKKPDVDTKALLPEVMKKYKVVYVPGASFYYDGSNKNSMRLNFTFVKEETIREGIKRLAQAFKDLAGL